VVLRGQPTLYFLGFDPLVPPFDDVEVRRAVSMAVNRGALARATLEGNVRPARSLVPASIPGALRRACRTCSHRPDEARATLATRGVAELGLWFNADAGHEPVMGLVAADLSAVGPRVTSTVVDFPAYLDGLRGHRAGLFRFGWTADYPTLDNVLYPLLHSGGRGNLAGFVDPEIDALLDQARATLDGLARRDLYRRVEALALERQALVPLFTFRHRLAVSDRVDGFTIDPFGRPDLAAVTVRDPGPAAAG
jgi:peptide/nickel transport system substrate-binding protein/oligopeptide transport system substrate-binding protein